MCDPNGDIDEFLTVFLRSPSPAPPIPPMSWLNEQLATLDGVDSALSIPAPHHNSRVYSDTRSSDAPCAVPIKQSLRLSYQTTRMYTISCSQTWKIIFSYSRPDKPITEKKTRKSSYKQHGAIC